MRVLVMGAGAIGSVVGGFLAEAGHEVTLVGRAAHVEAVRTDGLHITGIWGEHHVHSMRVLISTEGLEAGDFDLILITAKSYDTRNIVCDAVRLVDGATLVCSYQNGLGNAETIAEVVGWQRTVGARAIFGSWLREPGWAEVTVIAAPTALGVYHSSAPAERVRELVAAMDSAGVPTVFTDEIATVLWSKVTYNCALNPLSGLLDVPYGALLDTEHTRSIMHETVHEVYAVAGAMGVPLKPPAAEEYVDQLFHKLIPPTAAHYASMREDFRRRRRTEIDALNGAIVRYGDSYGVATPANRMLTRLVHAREYELMKGAGSTPPKERRGDD